YWLEHDERVVQRQNQQAKAPGGLAPQTADSPEKCVIYADGVMVHTDGAWHEARVGVVRTQRDDQTRKSSIVRLSDPHAFGQHLWSKAVQMGCNEAQTLAFIADGSHWLWRMCDRHFDGAIRILDFYHLAQHVHACAAIHFGEGSDDARKWAMVVLGTLRAGETDAAMKDVEALSGRSKAKRQAKHELITYLSNNR